MAAQLTNAGSKRRMSLRRRLFEPPATPIRTSGSKQQEGAVVEEEPDAGPQPKMTRPRAVAAGGGGGAGGGAGATEGQAHSSHRQHDSKQQQKQKEEAVSLAQRAKESLPPAALREIKRWRRVQYARTQAPPFVLLPAAVVKKRNQGASVHPFVCVASLHSPPTNTNGGWMAQSLLLWHSGSVTRRSWSRSLTCWQRATPSLHAPLAALAS